MAEQPKYMVVTRDESGNLYEFEKATNLQWEWYENEVGKCMFHLPHNDTKLTTTSIPQNAFSEIRIYRDGSLVWQGFITLLVEDKDGTTVYGLTYMECLKWYRVGFNTTYTTKKIGSEIISPIYDIIVAYTNDIIGAKITKGTLQDPYTTGSSSVNKTITKTVFDEDFFSILKDMVDASRADSPSGSWKQDSVFDISFSDTAPTFSFLRDVGSDKSDVVFEMDSEIVNFSFMTDVRTLFNDSKGFAIQSGPTFFTSSQIDTTSRSTYYLRQFSPYFGTVTSQAQLDEMTKDILKKYKDPTQTLAVEFAANIKPFDGYSMGDAVKVRIVRGRVNIDAFYRVVGMEVFIDDKGIETAKPLLQVKRS